MYLKNKKILLILSLIVLTLLTGCQGKEIQKEDDLLISERNKNITEELGTKIEPESIYIDYFTIYGEVELLEEPIYYNSSYVTNYLKASEDSYIEFVIENEYEITIKSSDECNESLYINNTKYNFENGEIKALLESGTYKIKSPNANIYYIDIKEKNNALVFNISDGIYFSVAYDDVKITEKESETIYELKDGSIIKKENNKFTLEQLGTDDTIKELFSIE